MKLQQIHENLSDFLVTRDGCVCAQQWTIRGQIAVAARTAFNWINQSVKRASALMTFSAQCISSAEVDETSSSSFSGGIMFCCGRLQRCLTLPKSAKNAVCASGDYRKYSRFSTNTENSRASEPLPSCSCLSLSVCGYLHSLSHWNTQWSIYSFSALFNLMHTHGEAPPHAERERASAKKRWRKIHGEEFRAF